MLVQGTHTILTLFCLAPAAQIMCVADDPSGGWCFNFNGSTKGTCVGGVEKKWHFARVMLTVKTAVKLVL